MRWKIAGASVWGNIDGREKHPPGPSVAGRVEGIWPGFRLSGDEFMDLLFHRQPFDQGSKEI
jgi:hypothetical protein